MRISLEGKVTLCVAIGVVLAASLGAWLTSALANGWVAWLIALAVTMPLAFLVSHALIAPANKLFGALRDGVSSLKDGDFSTSIAADRRDELGELVGVYNELGDVLRRERQSLFQRELLLDTVIQTTPLALVLINQSGRVVYSNSAARLLFCAGKPLNGLAFDACLADVDPGFARAVRANSDGLFSIDEDGEPQTYYLSNREFTLNGQPHRLLLFKQLTHELGRQEVATWKKVIRVISHELNNSLAPISSLAHSGLLVLEQPDSARLESIFATIEERSNHLKTFIEGYARFARLPAPRVESVDVREFVDSLQRAVGFALDLDPNVDTTQFDPGQMEQVMINLLKNAHESGSPAEAVQLRVTRAPRELQFEVLDAGGGMSDQVLKSALLPFYSTKQTGTGLGLPLCREIVEAHGGRLAIANRAQGGLVVSVALPAR